jgi:hypothetical protein
MIASLHGIYQHRRMLRDTRRHALAVTFEWLRWRLRLTYFLIRLSLAERFNPKPNHPRR